MTLETLSLVTKLVGTVLVETFAHPLETSVIRVDDGQVTVTERKGSSDGATAPPAATA